MALVLLAFVAASLFPSAAWAQDNLIWNPENSATGSDGSGTWTAGNNFWYDESTSSETSYPGTGTYANVTIGDGGTLPAPTDSITMGSVISVGNITFDPVSGGAYDIVDTSGTASAAPSDPLVLSNATTTITDTNTAGLTSIQAALTSAHPFTLDILGTGQIGLGGSIGTAAAPATLQVGGGVGNGYTGTVFLAASNTLAGTTIGSRASLSVTNNSALGPSTASVTLAGGTLQLTQGAIGVHLDGGQAGKTNMYTPITSTNSAGAYPIQNWNNFQIFGKPPVPTNSGEYGALLTDGNGVPTNASVTYITGNNTYGVGGAVSISGLTGNQQLLFGGSNAGSTAASITLSNIPYSSYSVYAYAFGNNNSTGPTNLELTGTDQASNNPAYYFNIGAAVSNSNANPSSTLEPITSTDSGSPTTDLADSGGLYEGMYAVWSSQSGNTATITLHQGTLQNPWLSGVEIVAAPILITNAVSVTSSSTINLGNYLTVPQLAGGLTVANGSTLSFTGTAGSQLNVGSATNFTAAGGTLSPATGLTLELAGIIDQGFGFNTSSAGTVLLTSDNSATATGPVTLGCGTQLSMSSSSSGSATGSGNLAIGGTASIPAALSVPIGAGYTGNGIISPSNGHNVTVLQYGSVVGPASGGTLNLNGAVNISGGTVTGGSGTLLLGSSSGMVSVNSGGALTTGAGTMTIAGGMAINSNATVNIGLNGTTPETITTSGGLTLAGGTSNYLLSSSGTGVSGIINATDASSNPSLSVTGSHTIDPYFGTNPLPVVNTTYDLIEYSASSPIATTGGNNGALVFQGSGQGGSILVSSSGSGAIPATYQYQLVDNVSAGAGEYYVQLQLAVPSFVWTGAISSNWDSGSGATANWAAGTTASVYSDGYVAEFTDTNPISGAPITANNITISVPTVSPAGVTFDNNLVNYTIASGGAISGSAIITLNGTASVTLANSNTFTGPVAVNAGELNLQNSEALGNTSGVSVASGGALTLQGGISIHEIPLSINGTGWATTPAGALDSISGANSYAGAISLTGAATIGSANLGDTLILSGGIADGANNLTFIGAGNVSIDATGISGSGTVAYNGSGTLFLGVTDTLTGAVQVNSGTLLLTNAGALGNATRVTVAGGAAVNLQGGIGLGTNPLTISGAGLSGSPTGALNSISGSNSLGGAITLGAAASIGSSNPGDTLTLSGKIIAGSQALAFIGAGNTTVGGAISGSGGSVAYSGAGTLQLNSSNSYTGGTTIGSGTVIAAAGALGTGSVTMSGGALRFSGAAIGMNVASYLAAGTYNTIPSNVSAGVVPIINWNNLDINHSSNPTIVSGQAGDTPLPIVLANSSGTATTANVAAWTGNNGYGNPAGTTGDAKLLSSGLNANPDPNDDETIGINPATVTIKSIPYATYNVYVYYWNDVANAFGSMSIASGATTLTTNPTTYYFNTGASTDPSSYVIGSTSPSTPTLNADYAVWTGVIGTTLQTSEVGLSSATPWIAGIEIVADSLTYTNAVKVTANSTIDVTGITTVKMGALSISNGSVLNVTGGSDTGADPYLLTLGAVTLSSNAIFNVANNKNGAGGGTLNLGAIGDGTLGYSVGLIGPGTVGLTSATGSTYRGGTNISAGTLQLYDMLTHSTDTATGTGAVAISGSGMLAGPTNVGGNAYISGAVSVTTGGAVEATSGASLDLKKGLSLASGSAADFLFNGAAANGTGAALIVSSGTTPSSLSIGAKAGDMVTINLSGTPALSSSTETYDLLSYTGTALSATASNNNQTLTFSNGAELNLGTRPSGPVTGFELVNNTSGKQIDLEYTVSAESWTGDDSANWDTTAAGVNYAIGSSPTASAVSFANSAAITFGDTDNTNGNRVKNTSIVIQNGGVQPSSVVFTNNSATYMFRNATNPATTVDDITGIAGTTGITINGTGGVIFTDANAFTGAVQINAGYLQTYTNSSPSPNFSANVNGLGSATGATIASGAELQVGTLSDYGYYYTYGVTANGSSTIPLSIAGTGVSHDSNGIGALSSAGGINTYAGSITLTGDATINSNSPSNPDQLILTGGMNTAGHALTFNGPGKTAVPTAIAGSGGSIANTGGTLTLAGNNSFSGGTTISSGIVQVASNTALGSGAVYLQGATLDFIQGNGIGVNVASNGASPLTNPPPADFLVNSVAPGQAVGAMPTYNWNNLIVVHNTNSANNIGSPAPPGGDTPGGSSVAPLALNDSTGSSSGASVTSWSGSTGYSVAPSSNGTAQMLSSWLLDSSSESAAITLSNIPYSNYSVYVYFYNNNTAYGQASISTSSTSYYFETYSNSPPTFLTQNTTTTNPGSNPNGYQQSDYAVWTGQTSSTLTATLSEVPVTGDGTSGISGIEIVDNALVLSNALSISANSAINVTGPSSVIVGPLSIGANTLTVTGGSTGTGMPYSLTTGTVTLSGNATFNVANNGSGAGVFSLGAISDLGSGDGITINNNGSIGTVVLSAGGAYTGTTNVQAGTLRVVGALASNGGINVFSAAKLSGPVTAGSASIAGQVSLSGTLAVIGGAPLSLTGGLTIHGGSSSIFTLSGTPNGAGGAAMIATSGADPTSLAIEGNETINIVGTPDGTPGSYIYDLFSYTGAALSATGSGAVALSFAGGNLSLDSTPSGPYSFALSNNSAGKQIDLTLTTFGFTWNGPTSGAWDTTSFNWQSLANSVVTSSTYTDGGSVLFTDNNLNGSQVSNASGLATLNVQSMGVNPGTVAFTNVGASYGGVDYQIDGGPIGGTATALDKSGTGAVTFQNGNTYGGGTFITGGTLATASGGTIGPGPLALSAIRGVTAAANLGTSQSVSSITNMTAVGGTTRLTVAPGATITSTGTLSNTGMLNINVAGQSGGNVVVQSAPVLNAGSNLEVNAGTLEFNPPSNNPATVQTGASVTVAAAATLELAGSSSALSDGASGNVAEINNHGLTADGGGLIITGANETVGIITGAAARDANNATVYDGDTVVGSGAAASLTASQILQNSLVINANSSVTILPSDTVGEGATISSTANGTSSSSSAATNETLAAAGGSDALTAIKATLASTSTLRSAITALRDLVSGDPGLLLSPADDAALYHDYQISSSGVSLLSAGSGATSSPALVRDLTADGLTQSEIISLSGNGADSLPAVVGIGSLSPALDAGSGTTAVPEPSTFVLAVFGLIAVGLELRRRKRAHARRAGRSRCYCTTTRRRRSGRGS